LVRPSVGFFVFLGGGLFLIKWQRMKYVVENV